MVVDPFRGADCTVEVDGAFALVVTSLDRARDLRQPPAVIASAGYCSGPRWDFGFLAVAAIRRRYRTDPNPTGDLDVSLADLARHYGTAADLAWFAAASCLKYTAILGYNLALHRTGRRPDPVYEQLLRTIRGLPVAGMAIAAGPGLR